MGYQAFFVKSRWFPALLVLTCWFLLCAAPTRADSAADAFIKIAEFSTADVGTDLPVGWERMIFEKISKHTEYRLVEENGLTVVRARSEAAASGLTRKVSVDLAQYPMIQWRWKVLNVIEKSDVRTKKGDDYAARIYITFQYDPDRVGFLKKAKYKVGRLLFGDIPIAAVNYIWESKAPVGTIVDNAYTDFVKMIVVESGAERVGEWVQEERNLYEDYVRAFGEEPPLVNGVAIMTDTDNTGEKATAFFGDIFFKKKD